MSHASANGQRPLPPGWKWRRFGEIARECSVRAGGDSALEPLSVTKHRGFVRSADYFDKQVFSRDTSNYKVVRRGQFAYATIHLDEGSMGILREHEAGLVSPMYTVFELTEGDPEFVFTLLKSAAMIQRYQTLGQGSLHRRKSISFDTLAKELIPWAPIAEQRLRLGVISVLNGTLGRTKAVVTQLERTANALCANLLDHTDHKDWPMKQIGALCSLSGGTGFGPATWSESGLPIIRIQNLNGSTRFNYFDGPPEDDWIVEPGDLLFAWAGVRGVSFGPTIWPGPRGLLNQHIYRVRPAKGVSKRWLYEILRAVTHRIESRAHGFKASLLHVHKKEITGQLVPVPPKREQQRIAAASEALETARRGEMSALEAFEATATHLVSHLVAGGTTE